MDPYRIDYIIDFAYGVMIFVSVVLIISVGTEIGIAFGLGVLVSYAIHVVWKMARFDPEWMTKEVTENVEDTLTREIEDVINQLEEVNERIDRRPRADEIENQVDRLATTSEDQHRENQDRDDSAR
jgi:hypothetical protein